MCGFSESPQFVKLFKILYTGSNTPAKPHAHLSCPGAESFELNSLQTPIV